MIRLIAVVFALATGPAMAQSGMTEAQILDAFAKQKTRGLSIAPAQGTDVAGERPDAPAAAGTGTQIAFDAVPKEEQVQISISFDFDSAALRPDQRPRLATLCGAMKVADVQTFRILGHTDASGSAAYNQRLSQLRAEEVKRYIVANCGIADDRMIAVGVGEEFPYDAADPTADVNRRVEFQVLG